MRWRRRISLLMSVRSDEVLGSRLAGRIPAKVVTKNKTAGKLVCNRNRVQQDAI